ncbi:MAG: hypothetical protein GYB53_24700, partial [Rhodobacteraceae bacterium]|nr:hypothetical protein [Paracoccaceae bacterium]
TAALIYIANEQALIAWLAAHVPGVIAEDGSRVEGGIARTASYPNPGQANDGPAGLYANLTPAQVAQWTALAEVPELGITILGRTPYEMPGQRSDSYATTGAALYAQVRQDAGAWALWSSVASIPARPLVDEAGAPVLDAQGAPVMAPASIAMPSVQ